MATLSVRETAQAIRRAREFVSPIRMEKGKGYSFATGFPGAMPYKSPPTTKFRAKRQRLRTVFQIAAADVGGIGKLHPEGVGKLYQPLLATMQREAAGTPRKTGWKWSEETRARVSRERKEHFANLKVERSQPATLPPLTPEQAQASAVALATARGRIAARFPTLPPASAEWLARFAASPL